ncbi:MAG: hypothetical protein WBS14_09640, partial [Rhodomicrobium sp.]
LWRDTRLFNGDAGEGSQVPPSQILDEDVLGPHNSTSAQGPAADIGRISESARCWVMSRRSCLASAPHSKHSFSFSHLLF